MDELPGFPVYHNASLVSKEIRNASLHVALHFSACCLCIEQDHMMSHFTIHISSGILMGLMTQIGLFTPSNSLSKPQVSTHDYF